MYVDAELEPLCCRTCRTYPRHSYDPGALVTAIGRYLPSLLESGPNAAKLSGPFAGVLDGANIRDPFIRNWLDLLSFLLSGLPANGTVAAEVVSARATGWCRRRVVRCVGACVGATAGGGVWLWRQEAPL